MNLHAVFGQVKCDVGVVKEVIGKIFLDEIAFVAEADNKIFQAVVGVQFHDVP